MVDLEKHAEAIFAPFGVNIIDMDDAPLVKEVMSAIRALAGDAYRAGQEAMRERASDIAHRWPMPAQTTVAVSNAIRALPTEPMR